MQPAPRLIAPLIVLGTILSLYPTHARPRAGFAQLGVFQAMVREVTHSTSREHAQVVVELDREAAFDATRLSNPDRVFVDISGASLGSRLMRRDIAVGEDLLRQIRIAQNRSDVVRVVLDLGRFDKYSTSSATDPFRIVIDIYRGSADRSAAAASPARRRSEIRRNIETLLRSLEKTPNLADARMQLALHYKELEQWDEAEKQLRIYLQQHPGSAEAHDHLASIYAQQGKTSLLEEELKTLVRLKPEIPGSHIELAEIYLSRAALTLWRGVRHAAPQERNVIESRLLRILDQDTDSPDGHFIRGHLARIHGNEEQAREMYARASQDARFHPLRLVEEARGLADRGSTHEALDLLEAVSVLAPETPGASLLAARILLKQNDPEGALRRLDAPAGEEPPGDDHVLLRADALETLGRLEETIPHLEASLARRDSRAVRRRLADTYKRTGQYTRSLREYERLLNSGEEADDVRGEIMDLARRRVVAAETTNGSNGAGGLTRLLDRVPMPLLYLQENERCVLVEKESQTLFVFRRAENGFQLEKAYSCSTGANDGEKAIEGDEKTPEGVYLFEKVLSGSQLPEMYGRMAITLDYPNPLDQNEGKSGTGIWVHATNEPIRPYLPNKTRGCVLLSNEDILELSNLISLRRTPLVIVSKLGHRSPAELESELAELRSFLTRWSRNWQSRQLDEYIELYSKEFRNGKLDRVGWRAYKAGVFSHSGDIELTVDLESIIRHEKYAVLLFRQNYRSDRIQSTGTKRLFVVREDGDWKIVAEEWTGS